MANLEELKKQKICHLKLELPLEELKRLMEFWFNNPDSDYNIGRNFAALQEKHKEYFTPIENFIQDNLNVPSTLEDLQEKLNQLGKAQNKLEESLGSLVLADERFTYSLDTLVKGLSRNKSTIEKIVNECDYPKLKVQFNEMLSAIQSWIDKAIYVKAFVLEASRKRSLVFEIVRGKLELYLQSEFAKLSGQELEDLKNQIDVILAARDLLIEIENWWFNTAISNGFGGGYLTRYLQFEKPLFIMRADYAQGLSFKDRIKAMSLPPQTKDFLEEELEKYLEELKTQIDELIQGGWKSRLERQKLLVEARERRNGNLSINCKVAIKNFKEKATDVKTLLDYRDAEEAYKLQIDACQA